MSTRRPSCPFCLEADCLCDDDDPVFPVPEDPGEPNGDEGDGGDVDGLT